MNTTPVTGVHTPGPWFVRDMRASELRRLGWTGPSLDTILITDRTGAEIVESKGENCVVARISFDNRVEELTDGNLADAQLIAAAPDMAMMLRHLLDGGAIKGVDDTLTASIRQAVSELLDRATRGTGL